MEHLHCGISSYKESRVSLSAPQSGSVDNLTATIRRSNGVVPVRFVPALEHLYLGRWQGDSVVLIVPDVRSQKLGP